MAPSLSINASVCNEVADRIWRPPAYNDFPTFRNTVPIRMAHSGVPRGGRSNDVLKVVTGSQQEKQEYVKGLLVSAIIILCFFGAWIILLIFLKCMGRNKVGWLSGRRQPLPAKPKGHSAHPETFDNYKHDDEAEMAPITDKMNEQITVALTGNPQEHDTKPPDAEVDPDVVADREEVNPTTDNHQNIEKLGVSTPTTPEPIPPRSMDEWNQLYATKMKQEFWLKVAVVVSCLTVIAMAVVMAIKGIQSLRGSLTDGKVSINYAQVLLNKADETLGGLIFFLTSFQSDVQFLLQGANQICPQVQLFLCEDLNVVDTCNTAGVFGQTEAGQKFMETFEHLVRIFYQDWKIVAQLEGWQQDLRRINSATVTAEEQISTFDWVFYVAVMFDVLVGILALVMIVFLLTRKKMPLFLKCIHHWCLFPTFIVFVFFSFIFAIAFLIASMVLSDTCADDPDKRMLAIARHYFRGDVEPYMEEFATFWLSRCNVPPRTIDRDEQSFQDIYAFLVQLRESLAVVNDQLVEICGTPNPTFLTNAASSVLGYSCVAVAVLWSVKEAFQCSTWMPLYYNTVYNAMCYNGVNGVWSIAATQYLTSFMACIILTCRCVFFDLEVEGEDGDVKDAEGERNDANNSTDIKVLNDGKDST
ncbi:hypothetical protein IV203_018869 [Nitzschia inconspicua]|uniref:Transmembrane protein n=1 Tax=Nitzschia inconspicua TaxID=303405 RepID=A0A9K3M490_9STRA|nr:hypothetical protein IV203_018869 [Nitzschia inconspicua]